MFENSRVTKDDPAGRMFPDVGGEDGATGTPTHRLDSQDARELHSRLLGFWHQELDRQAENRLQMATDEDFYDHIQWREEDAEALRDRGQNPIVYNVIAQTINWILGTQRRGRTDWKVYPRGKEDAPQAQLKTELMKYVSDVNLTPFHVTRAFDDAAKVGIGWLESGVDPESDGEIVYDKYESWRNILWDSSADDFNMEDARYIFRSKWLDADIARALVPDRKHVIDGAAMESSSLGYNLLNGDEAMDEREIELNMGVTLNSVSGQMRERVRVIEAWFRKIVDVDRFTTGKFAGMAYDDTLIEHQVMKQLGAQLKKRPTMRVHMALMTTDGLLWLGQSPYRHNKLPFTPIWCFRRGRDGMPYGFIRGLRDIQEDINKRASKTLAILSMNKVKMEEGAVDDMDEFMDEKDRPDGVIKVKAGKMNSVDFNVDRNLSDAHLELMSRNISMIQSVSGVTDELLGKQTNATSGVAVQARQEQGSLTTSIIFENLRMFMQVSGQKRLSLIEQYFTDEKTFRITNERGVPSFKTVNDGLPENDITATQADFVVGEADWRATMRQAQTDQLIEMLTKMPPDFAVIMFDLVVDMMDVPNREEIVKRIRAKTGAQDPDRDPNAPPTPEEQAAQEAAAKNQAMQEQMVQLDMRLKEAEAILKETKAQREAGAIVGDKLTQQKTAVDAAREVALTPGAAPVADVMLKESGFESQTDLDLAAAEKQAAVQREAAAAAQQQQAATEPAPPAAAPQDPTAQPQPPAQ